MLIGAAACGGSPPEGVVLRAEGACSVLTFEADGCAAEGAARRLGLFDLDVCRCGCRPCTGAAELAACLLVLLDLAECRCG